MKWQPIKADKQRLAMSLFAARQYYVFYKVKKVSCCEGKHVDKSLWSIETHTCESLAFIMKERIISDELSS